MVSYFSSGLTMRHFLKRYFIKLNNGAYTPSLPAEEWERLEMLRGEEKPRERYILHLLLFVLTMATTTMAGGTSTESLQSFIISGLPYSLTLLTILSFHEFGHYFAAKRFGVDTTLPFFIPLPLVSIIGTMGAVIKLRSPIPHRRALLYIGAAGPMAGFLVSSVAVIYGVAVSEVVALPEPLPEGLFIFGDSLLIALVTHLFHGSLPVGHDIMLSPWAWAGWIGFFITSLNLMPMGQLDGGHILYALIGKKQRYFGWAMLTALLLLTFRFYGWLVWIFFTFLFIMVGHPQVEEGPPLSKKERIFGWVTMAILPLTFIPVPVTMAGI